ncbi:MAG: cobalt-precorrin-5B (C(1))-methyltransferase, partial [Deltaproteobacteria bacterium]
MTAHAPERPAREKSDRGRMRTGFTTGANACAAACAATRVALGLPLEPWSGPLPELTADRYDVVVGSVEITIPNGDRVRFPVRTATAWRDDGGVHARCSVIKDGGDDPDCTHRAEIEAEVTITDDAGTIELHGGRGVGVVTRPGLGLPVGEAAINPVPRQNITEQVRVLLPPGKGARVVVGIVDGEALARKTLNARLGIVGGLSILGTTGIVQPYSTAAYRASVSQAIDVARQHGLYEVILTTGGRSDRAAQALRPDLPEPAFVQMGDFVGHALDAAARAGLRRATICAMMGKLSKMADGRRMTHARGSAVNMDLLADIAASVGAPPGLLEQIRIANTGRHVMELVSAAGLGPPFFTALCERVAVVQQAHLDPRHPDPPVIHVMFVDFNGALLGRYPA